MTCSRLLRVAVLLLALAACAKKMLPPSPDRFAPRLLGVSASIRTQVEFLFDEDLDPSRLAAESIHVTGPDRGTVELRGVAIGRTPSAVQVWAQFESGRRYTAAGLVTDRAGNIGRFRAHFVAGSKADTIPPRLVKVEPAPGATGRRWGTAMRVRFSEAMDTALAPRWLVVPQAHESLLAPGWDPDWRGFRLTARESLPPGRPVYVLIQPGVQDLEGNPCSAWAYTYFSPDTGLFGRSVAGRVKWEAGPFGTGVVFFDAESSPGMALVARDGTFSTRVAGTNHEVIAVADTNGDGLADLSTSRLAIAAPSETVLFELRPDSLSLPLGAYRR